MPTQPIPRLTTPDSIIEQKRASPLRSFGRVKSRRLRPSLEVLVDDMLPRITPPLPEEGQVNPAEWFSHSPKQVWLELGFGGGEHLAGQARNNPDIGMIGCEPFLNGVAMALQHVKRNASSNVRVYHGDGRVLVDALEAEVLDRAFILFPDPWPKARHHKRRLINHELLDALFRVMKPGAELRIATDHAAYGEWILEHLTARTDFTWLPENKADYHTPPADWVGTRYEAKALGLGLRPIYVRFIRNHG